MPVIVMYNSCLDNNNPLPPLFHPFVDLSTVQTQSLVSLDLVIGGKTRETRETRHKLLA